MTNNIQELKEGMSVNDVVAILEKYDVIPTNRNETTATFPTCCHNAVGGSSKLIYYDNYKRFSCYTQCGESFDIFDLVIKIEKVRNGTVLSTGEAIDRCGFEVNMLVEGVNLDDLSAIRKIDKMLAAESPKIKYLKALDLDLLNNFSRREDMLGVWFDEGISYNVMADFGIRYSISDLAIVIPHYDYACNLIGVRGRFMEDGAYAKYMPMTFRGDYLAHALSANLYGINVNKDHIKKFKQVVLFESEKSVMKFNTMFPNRKIALATCGSTVFKSQIALLLKLGITEVYLCFDKDYSDNDGYLEYRAKYRTIATELSMYFNTRIVMDTTNLLNYKDSPIDNGKSNFAQLIRESFMM